MKTNTLRENNSISFINLYTADNPIFEIGDECFFIFFNSIDYHIPLIGRGTIVFDRFNDEINKHYFISIKELLNSKEIFDKFINDKQLLLYPYNSETLNVSTKPKIYKYSNKTEHKFFDENLFKIECFFTRKSLNGIKQLQQDYANIILEDHLKQITEIKEILI